MNSRSGSATPWQGDFAQVHTSSIEHGCIDFGPFANRRESRNLALDFVSIVAWRNQETLFALISTRF